MRGTPMLKLTLLAGLGGHWAKASAASAPTDHHMLQRSLEDRAWALNTRSILDNFSTCEGCQSILGVLKSVVADSDEALITLGSQLCATGTSYDEEFCQGTVEREAPAIAEVIRNVDINSTSSSQFCITFLGVCDYPKINTWAVPFESKAACNAPRPATSGKKPLKVIHYSDIHIDPLYVEGASTECDKPTCCRPYTEEDEPGKSKSPAGPNGDHKCDTPVSLEESMYSAIAEMFPDQAFTIFTGDIVDHALFNTSQPYNEKEIDNAYENMNDKFKLVYGTAGNHEAHPANIFEPMSQGNSTQWVYDALSEEWSRWIGEDATQDVESIGAYSTKYPDGNLRIISLNTNMFYRFNFLLYQKEMEKDPNGQIAWLVKELDAAEKAGENVYIIGHMPFGESDALPDQANYLDQVVKRYSSTIRAMFFGHTHVDHFEVSYSDYSKRDEQHAMAISYICPSLTPTSGMPSFRVYDVDPETFAVLDATTYMADMDDDSFQTSGPVWKKYYSAKEAYGAALSPPVTEGSAELSPGFWHNVTAAFEANTTLFDEYLSRKSRGWKAEECRDDCMKQEICQLRAGRSQDNCFTPKPGVHFSKRDVAHSHGEHDDCGTPVMVELLHAMAKRQDFLEMLQERFLATGGKIQPFKRAVSMSSNSSEPTASGSQEEECVSTPATNTPTSGTGSSTATDVSAPTQSGDATGVNVWRSFYFLTIVTVAAELILL